MKKISVILLICMLLTPFSVFASNDVAVHINGQPIQFDVPAQIVNDRTMVPMRKIFEKLGATVEWIETSQLIISTKGATVITMKIDDPNMHVSNVLSGESKTIVLDVAPVIIGDRTLVPVRAISESLGMHVDWDDVTRTVLITK